MGKKQDGIDLAWKRVEKQAIDLATAIIQGKLAEARASMDARTMPIMVDMLHVNLNIQVHG